MDKKKILVVDDDELFRFNTKEILSAKYNVTVAGSGQEALEIFEKVMPDLILSDLMMPGMSGFDMMDRLRAKYKFVIPVMFMTGCSGDEHEQKSLTTGAVDYIRKPFKGDVLLKRIDNIMSNLIQIKGLREAAENDLMTGLYNKTTSAEKIGALLKDGNGILLMIDLDCFKLVNDIYGHDKGDKILIKFAEILRSVMRSTDIIGRVGGDEFIAFCQNTRDEGILKERTRYLNERLVSYAREILERDMNIPLGCSIGACICPDEGTDYPTLFSKADKALYEVKQHGKHGFSIYKKADSGISEDARENSEIRMILGEREAQKGAYVLPLDTFKSLYRFLVRFERNYAWNMYFTVFTLSSKTLPLDQCVDKFLETQTLCLRGSDIVTKYGNDKIITILMKATSEEYMIPIDRIMAKWQELPMSEEVDISIEAERL